MDIEDVDGEFMQAYQYCQMNQLLGTLSLLKLVVVLYYIKYIYSLFYTEDRFQKPLLTYFFLTL